MKKLELTKKDGKLSFWNFIKWCFDFSWKGKKGWNILLALLIIFGINIGVAFLLISIQSLGLLLFHQFGKIIWSICFGIISPFVSLLVSSAFVVGLISLLFSIVRGYSSNVGVLFKSITWKNIWRILGGILLVGVVLGIVVLFAFGVSGLTLAIFREPWVTLLVAFAFIIAICPFVIKFKFFTYAVVDKSLDPIDALEYSWNITKGHFWEIVLLYLFFMLVMFIPYVVLGLFAYWGNIKLLMLLPLIVILMVLFLIPTMLISFSKYYLLISEAYDKTKNIKGK